MNAQTTVQGTESHVTRAGDVVSDLAPTDLDGRAVTTVRMLAVDMVEQARSGHPGLPLGAAPAAWMLWSRFLRHDPRHPDWPDRDRFVLSAGHGSALLYALLHVFGYDLPSAELRRFRQWGSRTPGHPEHGHTPGVETTTGPLGQGLAHAVGMALAERMLAARFNTPEHAVVDHRTWVLASDGDLMEGVSHEAASLAGHLGLDRLVVVFDDNDVTIDGAASQSCSDDVLGRFAACGWQTLRVDDGNDLAALDAAYREAVSDTERPTLIAVRTVIGYGAPTLAGTSGAHGSPLGPTEHAATRRRFGWPDGEAFHVPADVVEHVAALTDRGRTEHQEWQRRRQQWAQTQPLLAAQWDRALAGTPPAEMVGQLPVFEPGTTMATRKASGAVLAAVAPALPELVGGSADLAGSTNATIPGAAAVCRGDYGGRTVHFGIREHGMAAALGGIALHGGLRPYGSTFLVFSDYMRPSLRLAALMRQPVVYVFTHDSIMVGEDGPTHQPVEHVESLRLIPGMVVLRPADANETAACWRLALERTDGPTALVLTRQDLPVLEPPPYQELATDGAWVVQGRDEACDVVLAASGSEVALALETTHLLRAQGYRAQVLSVPWRERLAQRLAAGAGPVPQDRPVVWLEAGVPTGWAALARPGDRVIGLERFGASAPGATVYAELGFTADRCAREAQAAIIEATRR